MNKFAATLSQLSDEELMNLFRLGNVDAFDVLYHRHSPRVFGYLKHRVRSEQVAQDILQETFLKVHRYRARFNPKMKFLAWLFTLCRNSMIDALRAQKTIQSRVQLSDLDKMHSQDAQSDGESSPSVAELLTPLTAREQEVLSLRFGDDLPFSSIAGKLGLTIVNVRKIASRALNRLRKEAQ
jgi:RNA polymerase sigma-70 factor (ECF subfamily)